MTHFIAGPSKTVSTSNAQLTGRRGLSEVNQSRCILPRLIGASKQILSALEFRDSRVEHAIDDENDLERNFDITIPSNTDWFRLPVIGRGLLSSAMCAKASIPPTGGLMVFDDLDETAME
jgi:hypothetical protein